MQRIEIKYYVSRTTALTEGRCEYGEGTYQPSDTELTMLSAEERVFLNTQELSRSLFTLATGQPPTWPVIVEAIRAARQTALDKQAAELAERERQIVVCLAEPDEKWFIESTDWRRPPVVKSVSISIPEYHVRGYSWGSQDPRIVARLAALQPELDRRRAVCDELNAKAKADHEAAEQRRIAAIEAAEQAKQNAIDDLTQWCIEHGPEHLKRGAKDEYDVTGGTVQWLCEQLRDKFYELTHEAKGLSKSAGPVPFGDVVIIRSGTKVWDRHSWEERKSPGTKAFEVFDAVAAAVETIEPPTSVKVDVERIMHVAVEPPEDECDDTCKRTFTAIIVNVTHPAAAQRALVVEVKA